MVRFRGVLLILQLITPVFLLPVLTYFVLSVNYTTIPRYLKLVIALASIFVRLLFASYYRSFNQRRRAAKLNAIPIPIVRGSWPGNVDVLMRLLNGWKRGYINETLRDIFQEIGSPTVNLNILGVDQIWTCDPIHMKHILVTSFQTFDKGEPQRERMASFLGRGIFAADGELWKIHRSMIRPYLSKNLTADIPLFERHLQTVLSTLDNASSNGAPIDVQALAHAYTLDLALEAFFGMNVISMNQNDNDILSNSSTSSSAIKGFAHAMEQAAQITILRARRGSLWRIFEKGEDAIAPHAEIMHRWIDTIILHSRESNRDKGNIDGDDGATQTFVKHLVNSTEDDSLIRDQLINMLFGARDTTAALITFVIYFLASENEVCDKLEEEVNRLCPSEQGLPSLERLKDLIYLKAVINETLRVFPSVPINTKYSNFESVFPPAITTPKANGVYSKYYTMPLYMPPKTSISLIALLMQRRVDVWGADAETFRPERWLENASDIKRPPEIFVPFSAGPRLCPGQNFAYAEVSFFLIRIFQSGIRFKLAMDAQPLESRPPVEWKATTTNNKNAELSSPVFAPQDKARKSWEQCWPAAAFTLYSKKAKTKD
ncbi:hypothetical protein Clacol_010032 [Clathrus columnatus]|uniref:Cytochrome P450 n=1 Tax=Clathrus columnatus TaxID=1419009 RepID=A0AAV5ARI3_9AGAM|nr:hypothetical protein Clacol_010032 [Clathrus columnatus]